MQCNVLRYWNCCLYIDWVCDILGFYLILWQEGKIHKCAIPSFFWWCNPGIYRYIKEAMENIAADWWIGSFYFARLVLIKTENDSLKNGKTCNSGSLKNGKHCYIQYIYKIKRHFSRHKNTKTPWFLKGFCNQLPAGLEPATYALRMRCSTNWATEAPLKNAAAYATASDLSGNRTRVYAVRGRRLDRLTNRPWFV